MNDSIELAFQLFEKKLTAAELKKREEVAKALERENPDMPMDKKMAIATATAKRVAEAADDVPKAHQVWQRMNPSEKAVVMDKVGYKGSVTKTHKACIDHINKNMNQYKKHIDEATSKEEDDFHQELDKLVHKTFGKSKKERAMKESAEEILELSKKTLASYKAKADDDHAKRWVKGNDPKGINRAADKMMEAADLRTEILTIAESIAVEE